MPSGLKGEKRPADVIGAAVMVALIATGWRRICRQASATGIQPMPAPGLDDTRLS
jgi:hypothetical protein